MSFGPEDSLVPDRAAEDRDEGWGGDWRDAPSDDDRLFGEVPPHHGD